MEPRAVLTADEIDLSATEFWARPWDEREGAFQTLRRERPMPFYEEPEIPEALSYVIPKGKGYYALTRHAHIAEASRHPEIFQSGHGATSIIDMPEEMLDFFGSMINMDNPRHARLRRIVSAAFNPRMIKSIEDRIELVADDVIDRVAPPGRLRLRGRGGGPPAARDHLRHDGHRRRRLRHRVQRVERHPLGRATPSTWPRARTRWWPS